MKYVKPSISVIMRSNDVILLSIDSTFFEGEEHDLLGDGGFMTLTFNKLFW